MLKPKHGIMRMNAFTCDGFGVSCRSTNTQTSCDFLFCLGFPFASSSGCEHVFKFKAPRRSFTLYSCICNVWT